MELNQGLRCLLLLTVINVIVIENPRQTAGDTIAFVARESPVSDFECVLKDSRNCVATVNEYLKKKTDDCVLEHQFNQKKNRFTDFK